MKALLYVLVGATCIAVIGFIGNQLYRQREADRAAAVWAERVKGNLAASQKRLACEPVVERAKSFTTGSSAELDKLEADLAECGMTLSHIQR
jgi:hypothetical protein